jgi:hypothetical protein
VESLPTPHHTEKKVDPFLPATWFQSCLRETAELTGEHHVAHATPLPTPQENNPAQPLGRLNPSSKTEKHKQQTII